MAKKKPTLNRTAGSASRSASAGQVAVAAPAAKPRRPLSESIRETVEAVAIAFVLALLFRAFVAEAFVIPTGSMAPTLMGQHKDLDCPQCGYRYQVGASIESETNPLFGRVPSEALEVVSVMCPMCRYMASVDPRTAQGREYPTFGGDRILATRFTYELGDPKRWDVFIFKYPGKAQENYIKRCIGLPNETVRIWHGDIYVKAEGADEFQIERRSPAKLRAMAQIVYDNDYPAETLTAKGWPLRWQDGRGGGEPAWSTSDGGRSYEVASGGDEARWLRYRHLVPTLDDWERLKNSRLPDDFQPRPELITDFCAYNTGISRGYRNDALEQPALVGQHWVGDLLLECQVDVKEPTGKVLFDLVKGGKHFGCELDCASGEARLSIEGRDDFHPTAQTAIRGAGSHRVIFANVDRQLVLWVDGASVAFDGETTYEPPANDVPQSKPDDPLDLAPAGIAARSASLKVSHLRLWRDLYYIAARDGQISDYPRSSPMAGMNYAELVKFWSTPALWAPAAGTSPFNDRQEAIFPLAADQFLPLGDNSPASKDARLWEPEPYVSRDLLVGKALLIFWPHSFDVLPGTNIPFPFFPNYARMGFIR